jgi:hypothetical protein
LIVIFVLTLLNLKFIKSVSELNLKPDFVGKVLATKPPTMQAYRRMGYNIGRWFRETGHATGQLGARLSGTSAGLETPCTYPRRWRLN